MKRNKRLEKYIELYTGCNIKVITVKWIKGGYGASINSKKLKIHEDDVDYKPLIWHEMGHLMRYDKDWVKNEYKAQKWALVTLKKLKYNDIYEESIEWIKGWRFHISGVKYEKVAELILKEFDK